MRPVLETGRFGVTEMRLDSTCNDQQLKYSNIGLLTEWALTLWTRP